ALGEDRADHPRPAQAGEGPGRRGELRMEFETGENLGEKARGRDSERSRFCSAEGVDRSTAWPLLLHCRHYDALGPERLRDPLRALRGRFREVVDLPQDPHIADSRV